MEQYILKRGSATEGGSAAGESSKERKSSEAEGGHTSGSSTVSRLDNKLENLYKLIKEVKNKIVGKELIRRDISEAIKEEMDRVRQELQRCTTSELESIVGEVIKKEMQKIKNLVLILSSESGTVKGRSYSGAVKKEQKSVIIVKPREEEENNSSEDTKKDIKSKIDISKLGVEITKMRKVTRGAVVVGCENKTQADKLKEEVMKDLGGKYIIQAPLKKKLKIKILDVDKEDSDNERDF